MSKSISPFAAGLGLAILVGLSGCSDGGDSSSKKVCASPKVIAADGKCVADACASKGANCQECQVRSEGSYVCGSCLDGFSGAHCLECAAGKVVAADGKCVADACASKGANCRECQVQSEGSYACGSCLDGFSGAHCLECATGKVVAVDGKCVADACASALHCEGCEVLSAEAFGCTSCTDGWEGSACMSCPSPKAEQPNGDCAQTHIVSPQMTGNGAPGSSIACVPSPAYHGDEVICTVTLAATARVVAVACDPVNSGCSEWTEGNVVVTLQNIIEDTTLSVEIVRPLTQAEKEGVRWSFPLPPNSERFELRDSDTTVYDKRTGLKWQREAAANAMDQASAAAHCESNEQSLPGEGWRLPMLAELESIIDDSVHNPGIDTTFFIATANPYWSSSSHASVSGRAWMVHFYSGSTHHEPATEEYRVRCVQATSAEEVAMAPFTASSDGTVSDPETGLIWQGGENGDLMIWEDAVAFCAGTAHALPGAGWRLPTRAELLSLRDITLSNPAMRTDVFGGAKGEDYWSSSPGAANPAQAWYVNFNSSDTSVSPKTMEYRVRCVRQE